MTETEALELDEVERRILGHLPAWREDPQEALRLEVEGHSDAEIKALLKAPTNPEDEREGTEEDPRIIKGGGYSITSYKAPELTVRLKSDSELPVAIAIKVIRDGEEPVALADDFVTEQLQGLQKRGLAEVDAMGNWTMTQTGFEALTA